MKTAKALFPALLLAASAGFAASAAPAGVTSFSASSSATTAALAQKRDPLTENEADQIREASEDPNKKIKLYIAFINARIQSIEQMEGDQRLAAGRGQQVHNLLQDIAALTDELGDHIDDYVDSKTDIRKSLKDVIEADSSYQLKMRTLKDQTQGKKEFSEYNFALQDATDAVNGLLDDARQALDDLEKALKEEKKKK